MDERMNLEAEINACKNLLEQTDHIANKIIEGMIDTLQEATPLTLIGDIIAYVMATRKKYGETIANRAKWRSRINDLSDQLNKLPLDEEVT